MTTTTDNIPEPVGAAQSYADGIDRLVQEAFAYKWGTKHTDLANADRLLTPIEQEHVRRDEAQAAVWRQMADDMRSSAVDQLIKAVLSAEGQLVPAVLAIADELRRDDEADRDRLRAAALHAAYPDYYDADGANTPPADA